MLYMYWLYDYLVAPKSIADKGAKNVIKALFQYTGYILHIWAKSIYIDFENSTDVLDRSNSSFNSPSILYSKKYWIRNRITLFWLLQQLSMIA